MYWKERYHIPDNGAFSQIYGFSSSHVWIWELHQKECWALKNWWFWIAVLEKTLESLWTIRSNQSVLKEINPEYPLEGLMLKLKLEYVGHLIRRADSLEKKPSDAGKDWEQEEKGPTGWDGWMASLTQWTWLWANSARWWRAGMLGMLHAVHEVAESDMTEWLNNSNSD